MLKSLMAATAFTLSLTQSAIADSPMAFDVAEDHTRIFMASAPLHENGMPAHGNAFISQGYIYPEGTLEADTAGVNTDGSPAFPELVLGTWTCDGYFVGEGGNATTGVWIISRQVFDFGDGDVIVTQGTEIVDIGVENLRPITGAAGSFAEWDSAVAQTLLGFNEHMAVNATFRIDAEKDDQASVIPRSSRIGAPARYERAEEQLEWGSGSLAGPAVDAAAG